MKKTNKYTILNLLKILFFNFVVFLFFLFILEFIVYASYIKINRADIHTSIIKGFLSVYSDGSIEKKIKDKHFRDVVYGDKKRRPVVLFGCSFTFGDQLKPEETFSYQLSKYTNTTVYNYGVSGGSPKETLYLLRYYNDINNISNPQYVIYTYIDDHINRINRFGWVESNQELPVFTEKPNKTLKYVNKKNYIYKLRTFLYFNLIFAESRHWESRDLLNIYFKEIQNEINKKFPKSKFIILVYIESGMENWDDLKQNNIEIIHLSDLVNINTSDVQYCISEYDSHPNAKAWKVIVPALAKKLNL